MIRHFNQYGFYTLVVLFLSHQLLQFVFHVPFPIADNYLDPFCFSAILHYFYAWERKKWMGPQTIKKVEMVILWILISLISELVFPWISRHFTPDLFDVISIGLGSIWFWNTPKI